mmetsp:Transcript_24664/g.30757  ORF Transcript_24664/g.30757 Transcript_24664/m.30757 type:complete len:95 (+) Transcript_24664:92-376(+)
MHLEKELGIDHLDASQQVLPYESQYVNKELKKVLELTEPLKQPRSTNEIEEGLDAPPLTVEAAMTSNEEEQRVFRNSKRKIFQRFVLDPKRQEH